jgi:Fe-S-cluster containining protein
MLPVNFYSFRKKLSFHRKSFRRFLSKIAKTPPVAVDKQTPIIAQEVWDEVDCLTCANCCKKMTPSFTTKDLKRISAHFNQTPEAFSNQWLKKDKNKDMVNMSQPCQFLDNKTNKCSIYAIRPTDCSSFPHLTKKKWTDYFHVHKQNIDYCPAAFKMVEKMIQRFPFS